MADPRNSFSTIQINIGYFRWFPYDDNFFLGLLGLMRYDVYSPPFRIRQSHRIAGAPEGQNDSEYEQSEN